MRISYWSSDVCSSDLYDLGVQRRQHIGAEHAADHPGDEQAKEERPVDVAVEHMAQPRHPGGENLDDVDTRRRGRGGNAENRDEQGVAARSEEHTSELQSLMRYSYAFFFLKT